MKRYERYKPSNVEWIGEIPEHWQTIKIKYSTYVKGRVGWNGLTSSEFLIDGYSYLVTGTDFKDGLVDWERCYYIDQERYEVDPFIQLKENDLLITKDGTIGKTALVKNLDKPACLNSGIFVTRPLNGVYITPFMYWILNSFEFKKFFDFTSRGSTILHLYQNVFEDFIFAYPDIDEQKLIANYLDKKTAEIEELIVDKENLISLLEQEKELTISNAVTKGLNPNVSMKDSKVKWIDEIPKNWETRKLKYIGKFINGYSFNSNDFQEEGIRVLKISNIQHMEIDWSESSYVVKELYEKYPNYQLFKNDLVFALTRPIISTGIKVAIIDTDEKMLLNQRNAVFRTHNIEVKFIFYILLHKAFIQEFDNKIDKTGQQPNISSYDIGDIYIPLPQKEEQQQIVEYLDKKITETNETVQIIKDEIELLKEYKETLIYEVITGKIDVRGCNETH
ncbi:restriction endonuclease subunit S [Halarcobacter anaerophilus]|uniref:restriction endonuclease subunit S n=1 Tax=Halarcobacter anaerophilus TaxID=877500 RepID=UPI0005C8A9F0|nr:restriction endonuclease subunit S [Halarcobacter anaerophilus]